MGNPTICIGENKGADQLCGNREADQRLYFRFTDSTISSFYQSPVLVQLGLCRTWPETILLKCQGTVWLRLQTLNQAISKACPNFVNVSFGFQDSIESNRKMINFVKLHAPWEVCCFYAEDLCMRAPLQVSMPLQKQAYPIIRKTCQ